MTCRLPAAGKRSGLSASRKLQHPWYVQHVLGFVVTWIQISYDSSFFAVMAVFAFVEHLGDLNVELTTHGRLKRRIPGMAYKPSAD